MSKKYCKKSCSNASSPILCWFLFVFFCFLSFFDNAPDLSFRNGTVCPSLFRVANFDTFCDGLLILIFGLPRIAVEIDFNRGDSLVMLEVLTLATSEIEHTDTHEALLE